METESEPQAPQTQEIAPLPPSSFSFRNRKFILGLGVIVILIFVSMLLMLRAPQQKRSADIPLRLLPTPLPIATNVPGEWLKFTNSKYGYSLQYPRDFTVTELAATDCIEESDSIPKPLPMSGCRNIAEKGDEVYISNNKQPFSSSFVIRLNEKPEEYIPPDESCVNAVDYTAKEIIIDSQKVWEIYAKVPINTSTLETIDLFLLEIASSVTYKEENGSAGRQLCYNQGFTVNNFIMNIHASPPQIWPEDFATVEKILSTIRFMSNQ